MRASQEELMIIKKAMNLEKKARVFKRYQTLYLYLSGKTCEETAYLSGFFYSVSTRVYLSNHDYFFVKSSWRSSNISV